MSRALDVFSKRIELFLAEKGWSQADLAKASGLSRPQLNNYIKLKTPPGLEAIEKIAAALDHPVSDFFKEEVTLTSKVIAEFSSDEVSMSWKRLSEEKRNFYESKIKADALSSSASHDKKSKSE